MLKHDFVNLSRCVSVLIKRCNEEKDGDVMVQEYKEKDAERMISFFKDLYGEYTRSSHAEGLVSFSLSILNVSTFNISEVESALSDLRSIVMMISRELNAEQLEEFNNVVVTGINKIDMWLHGVYNHKISMSDEELFFGKYSDVISVMNEASKRVLRDDYFKFDSDGTVGFNSGCVKCDIDSDECSKVASDYIFFEDGSLLCSKNTMPWIDREVFWVGTKAILESRLNGKYRKVRDKRIVAIMKSLYEKLGDAFINSNIHVEDLSLIHI